MTPGIYFLKNGDRKVPKDVVRVRICNSVTKIRNRAFMNCTKLTEVEFSEGLEEIGEGAFFGCDSLEYVWLPQTTRIIGLISFKKCQKLKLVAMNEGLERIMDQAFESCPKLDNVCLPSTVRYVGSQAFRYCIEMQIVDLNEGLKEIKSHTFSNCDKLKCITLPASIESVDDTAIPSTTTVKNSGTTNEAVVNAEESENNPKPAISMDDVFLYHGGNQKVPKDIVRAKIDPSVKKIPAKAFENCKDLKVVDFAEGLKKIDKHGFANCSSLEAVCLPSTTEIIGKDAFYGCGNLKDVRLNKGLKEIKRQAFSWCERMENVSLPSTMRTLGSLAFSNCTRLKEVHLNDGLVEVGDFACCNCKELRKIRVPTSVERVGREAFPKTAAQEQEPATRHEPEASDKDLKEAPDTDMGKAVSKDDDQKEEVVEGLKAVLEQNCEEIKKNVDPTKKPEQTRSDGRKKLPKTSEQEPKTANQDLRKASDAEIGEAVSKTDDQNKQVVRTETVQGKNPSSPDGPVATMEVVERLEAELKQTREELQQNVDRTKKLEATLSEGSKENAGLRDELKQLKDTVLDRDKHIIVLQTQVEDGAANLVILQAGLETLKRQLAMLSRTPAVSQPPEGRGQRKRPRREDNDVSVVPNAATSSMNMNQQKNSTSDDVIDLT